MASSNIEKLPATLIAVLLTHFAYRDWIRLTRSCAKFLSLSRVPEASPASVRVVLPSGTVNYNNRDGLQRLLQRSYFRPRKMDITTYDDVSIPNLDASAACVRHLSLRCVRVFPKLILRVFTCLQTLSINHLPPYSYSELATTLTSIDVDDRSAGYDQYCMANLAKRCVLLASLRIQLHPTTVEYVIGGTHQVPFHSDHVFSSLVAVNLSCQIWDSIHKILGYMPALTHATFRNVNEGLYALADLRDNIRLRSRHGWLASSSNITHLTLGSLCINKPAMDELFRVLRPSCETLVHMTLDECFLRTDDETVAECCSRFRAFPNLQRLVIARCTISEEGHPFTLPKFASQLPYSLLIE